MAESEQPLTWPVPSLGDPELVIAVCHYLLGTGKAAPADLSTLKPNASQFPEFSPACLTHLFHLVAHTFPSTSPTAAVEVP